MGVETAIDANLRTFALAIEIGFSGHVRPRSLLASQPADFVSITDSVAGASLVSS